MCRQKPLGYCSSQGKYTKKNHTARVSQSCRRVGAGTAAGSGIGNKTGTAESAGQAGTALVGAGTALGPQRHSCDRKHPVRVREGW